jgi:hypothetical protein
MAFLESFPLALALPPALIFLGLITWLALSPRSSPRVRRAAAAALALTGLAVILGLILIFGSSPAAGTRSGPGAPSPEPPASVVSPSPGIIVFSVLRLGFLALIIFLALRKERASGRKQR